MAIGDLKTEKGIKDLDAFMVDNSYVGGYLASKADLAVFESIPKAPAAGTPHVLRWYNHIKNLPENTKKQLPGEKKVPANFGAKDSAPPAAKKAEDDDDVDLFGSDEEEDKEATKIREQRLKEYADKKSKKPGIIAKSSIVLDVKPWDDETDMKMMEEKVRTIVKDGLVWGASKLVPVGYGINKLQIMCVVEDEKISVDELAEEIQEFQDYVQSVDIAAFNKI